MCIRDRLVSYLENQNLPLDKNLWFKFDRLQFDIGKASIQSSSQDQLKYIANIMMSFPKVKLRISGFTDNTGDPKANLKLSTDRAYNVMNELINLGVAKNRLSSEGWGGMYPITENDTEEGRQKNRRIAIRVVEK